MAEIPSDGNPLISVTMPLADWNFNMQLLSGTRELVLQRIHDQVQQGVAAHRQQQARANPALDSMRAPLGAHPPPPPIRQQLADGEDKPDS